MGARSTGSHPTTTKADGHLLKYLRNTFVEGGGAAASILARNEASGGTKTFAPGPNGPQHYTVHTFTSSGSLVVANVANGPEAVAEVLIVAGGGGGGTHSGGGGGAGGLLLYGSDNGSKTANGAGKTLVYGRTYPVVVGGGGAGGHGNYPTPPDSVGADGNPSSFNDPGGPNFVATGGGGGGNQSTAGRPGGSGGGGGRTNPGGAGVSGQGFAGGYPGTTGAPYPGGGGGGA